MNDSFDIGRVLSKYPRVFVTLPTALTAGGHVEVYVITDMPDHDKAVKLLYDNGYTCVLPEHVLNADYTQHGIVLHVDDFPGYCANSGCVNLLVWPNPDKPYYADDFKSDDDVKFCRVRPKQTGDKP